MTILMRKKNLIIILSITNIFIHPITIVIELYYILMLYVLRIFEKVKSFNASELSYILYNSKNRQP